MGVKADRVYKVLTAISLLFCLGLGMAPLAGPDIVMVLGILGYCLFFLAMVSGAVFFSCVTTMCMSEKKIKDNGKRYVPAYVIINGFLFLLSASMVFGYLLHVEL